MCSCQWRAGGNWRRGHWGLDGCSCLQVQFNHYNFKNINGIDILPTGRCHCLVAVLPTIEVMVVMKRSTFDVMSLSLVVQSFLNFGVELCNTLIMWMCSVTFNYLCELICDFKLATYFSVWTCLFLCEPVCACFCWFCSRIFSSLYK
jgi:hypothetical protein